MGILLLAREMAMGECRPLSWGMRPELYRWEAQQNWECFTDLPVICERE